MDPELKRELDALRAELGKNVEALARVDAIEKAGLQREADTKLLRKELDEVKAAHIEREKAIQELQRAGRQQAVVRDRITLKREATEMLGMLARQLMSNHLRQEIPAQFAPETALVREHLQRATLAAGAMTGSYTVPTITESQLIDAIEEVSGLLALVDFVPGLPAASSILIPTLTTRPTLLPTRATVDTAMTQSDPAFGQMSLAPAEAYIYFPVDNRLIQMSALSLGTLLSSLLRDSIIEGICTWLLKGDGSASYNSITGILNEATAAYIYTLPAGKKAFADLAKSDLTGAKSKCLKRGRARGVWLASLDVQGLVEDMDRQGKVPVVTFAQDGTPRILQNPVVIDEGMPDLAESDAGKAVMGFGDLATWMVGLIGGIQIAVSTEYLFGKNQTAFRGVLNMDIKRKPVATFMTIKTASA